MKRSTKRTSMLLLAYSLGSIIALWISWQLRFDFFVPANSKGLVWLTIAWIIPLKICLYFLFRQFSGLISFFSVRDLFRVFFAATLSSLIITVIHISTPSDFLITPPRGVILLDFVLSFGGICSMRLSLRLYRERQTLGLTHKHKVRNFKNVAIIGAGFAGSNLAKSFFTRRGLGMRPLFFFDDDSDKWKSRIHDIPVLGNPEMLLQDKINQALDLAIIALPSASTNRIKEIIKIVRSANLNCQTIPSLEDLATGKVDVSHLRNIEIQDLLGREQVKLDHGNITLLIKNDSIMVTGAGGSIGSELCRQISAYSPRLLILVEQCEVLLFKIEQELIELGYNSSIIPIIGNTNDENRMRNIFSRFSPQIIFHAAAHKHVPMMENQPSEAFKNNALATAKIAQLAIEFHAKTFILISTDKAINPTNAMGASKRFAELYIQSLSNQNETRTKLSAVRFGNVLGSSGSVVPLFKKQIESGGPLYVTHPEVIRFFMTVSEAVGLVIQSAVQSRGGEIFVLDMGKAVKILDLAKQMIRFYGFIPDEDIKIEFIGLRPGEKMFEEISAIGENIKPTEHPKIMRFISEPMHIEEIRKAFENIESNLYLLSSDQLKALMQKTIPEYQPILS